MKKKIILFGIIITILGGYAGYKYVFKGPRDVSSEKAKYNLTANQLKADFTLNQSNSKPKCLGETIIVSGKVTEKTAESITLDNDVICVFTNLDTSAITLNSEIKIKGKCDGYDDLFEQVKLTESSLVN